MDSPDHPKPKHFGYVKGTSDALHAQNANQGELAKATGPVSETVHNEQATLSAKGDSGVQGGVGEAAEMEWGNGPLL